jgi:uncharacterized membrane protein
MSSTPIQLPQPSEDERTLALLVYVLGIFSGFLAPLIFLLVKKDSPFVKFHALQLLIWQAIYMAVSVAAVMLVFVSMIFTLPMQPHEGKAQAPPLAFFGIFGGLWLVLMGGWLLNLILGIVLGIKANQGQWVQLPMIGNWALRGASPNRPVS